VAISVALPPVRRAAAIDWQPPSSATAAALREATRAPLMKPRRPPSGLPDVSGLGWLVMVLSLSDIGPERPTTPRIPAERRFGLAAPLAFFAPGG
jgi:hypothetical protein